MLKRDSNLDDGVNSGGGLVRVPLHKAPHDLLAKRGEDEEQDHDQGSDPAGNPELDDLGGDDLGEDVLQDHVGGQEERDCYGDNQEDVSPPI